MCAAGQFANCLGFPLQAILGHAHERTGGESVVQRGGHVLACLSESGGEMLDTIAYRYIGIGLACGYSIHTDTQEVGTGIGYGTHAAWASAWSASG